LADFFNRERTDLDREERLLLQFQQIRESRDDERYPGDTDRADEEELLARQQAEVEEAPSDASIYGVAAAAIGVVAFLAARRRPSAALVRAIEGTGDFFRAIGKATAPARHAVDDLIFGPSSISRKVLREVTAGGVAEADLVRDIERAFSTVSAAGRTSLRERIRGTNTVLSERFKREFSSRYSGELVPEGMRHVKVSDILEGGRIAEHYSERSRHLIERAYREGIISPEMTLSLSARGEAHTGSLLSRFLGRGGAYGHFVEGDRVINTTWARPGNLLDLLHAQARKVSFGGVIPADFLYGIIHSFRSSPIATTVGKNTLLPTGAKTGKRMSISIGGDVFELTKGGWTQTAEGMRVHGMDKHGAAMTGRAIAARTGTLAQSAGIGLERQAKYDPSFFKRAVANIQLTTGVGPAYAVERSWYHKIKDVYERLTKGVFIPHEYATRGSTLSYLQKQSLRKRPPAELVEAAKAQGLTIEEAVEQYLQQAVRRGDTPLTPGQNLASLLGSQKHGQYVKMVGDQRVPIGNVRTPPITPQGRSPLPAGAPKLMGKMGTPTSTAKATGMVSLPGAWEHANLLAHHLTERFNRLAAWTTGIGFKPSSGRYGWMLNLLKIYGAVYAGKVAYEELKYLDYIAGEPSKAAVKAYAELQEARQEVREGVGIAPAARYLEGLMPGSVESPLSIAARTVGPPIFGLIKGGKKGLIAGAVASLTVGGSKLGIEPEELEDIYEGEKLVPVSRNRWWMLGLGPWSGDRVDYYRPHWVARYLSDFRYTDIQYGSKGEYFTYASEAPTPHNLFHLRTLFGESEEEHYGKKHYYKRPYPNIRPNDSMVSAPPEQAYIAQEMGYEPHSGTYDLGKDPRSLSGYLSKKLDYVTELGGLYKFLAEQIPGYETLFGPPNRWAEEYAAHSETITSTSREFYDESVGGLLGLTEAARRFYDPNKGRQGINLIPNEFASTATWLPGAFSEFPRDRNYYLDFHRGDPYARISMGEARLPGEGYESLARLHSATPGVYDAMDRYLILASVAPYSEAYRHHKAIVSSWMEAGVLDKYWEEKFLETEEQVETVTRGPTYTPRIFSGTKSGTLQELARANEYGPAERAIGAGWEILTHDVVPEVGKVVPIVGTILDRKLIGQRSAYESYLEDQIYGSDFHDWSRPLESMLYPRVERLYASNPLTAAAGGLAMGVMFSPTPIGLTAGLLGGAVLGLGSTARAIDTGQLTGGYVPENTQEEWALQQYFDALKYVKNRRLQAEAEGMGRTDLARRFGNQAQRTAIGIDYKAGYEDFSRAARFAVSGQMRKMAPIMLQAPPESRQNILRVTSPMDRPLLQASWAKLDRDQIFPENNPDETALSIVHTHGMPGNDWAGWNPSVPMDVIKVKTLDAIRNPAYDIHHFNLWESDRVMVNTAYPSVEPAIDRFPTTHFGTMVEPNLIIRQHNDYDFGSTLPSGRVFPNMVRSPDDLLANIF